MKNPPGREGRTRLTKTGSFVHNGEYEVVCAPSGSWIKWCGIDGVSAALFAADAPPPNNLVEEIVAKCNGDIVTRGDLDRARRELMETLRADGIVGEELEKQLVDREKNLLRDRIDQLILTQKAKDLNISVDSDVTKQMGAIQSDSKIADPEKFQQYIKEQSGMSYEDFKQEMKNRFLTQHVIREEVTEKMTVKHEDLEKYYNEHKSEFVREEQITLQEILISTEGKDDAGVAAAEKKAKDLVARARQAASALRRWRATTPTP